MNLRAEYERLKQENQKLKNALDLLSSDNYIPQKDARQDKLRAEMLQTISHYLAFFSCEPGNKFRIVDLNSRVEQVELIQREAVAGKLINETSLASMTQLIELLKNIRSTGEPGKLSSSETGDDSEGCYMGFPLTRGMIAITWEPGSYEKDQYNLDRQILIFRNFAEMLPEIIYEVALDGKIKYGNQRGLDFFGYTLEDLKNGLNISDLFPESYKDMLANLSVISGAGQTASNEYYACKKDGTRVPVISHSFPNYVNNKIISYRGMLSDASKQKEYENQIIREKAFLEHIYDSAPTAIVITNPDGIVSMINKEFTNLFGFGPEEAVNRNLNDLIVPDKFREEAMMIDNLARRNLREARDTIRKGKDGNEIRVSLVASAIVINSEAVAHLGIYRDITLEKKNQLVQEVLYNISTAALKQYNIQEIYPTIVRELNKIWDTNNFFIALYDKGRETLSLPFFADEKDNFYEIPVKKTITGYVISQNRSMLLKESDLLELEEKGDIELVGTPCRVWMGVPLKVESEIIGVMCLQDYNDDQKFTNDDLHVMEFIANQIAMTLQRRIMLDNLVLARQKAEEAAQAKQQFMSTMSHEIRTPLNEVIGITNLLSQGNPREDQMEYLNTLRFSGNHLLTLVNDVLDYNKIESGKLVFEQTQFKLGAFLDEIMRSYSFRSKDKNLNFEIMKEGTFPEDVIGDPIRVSQILSNLLSNALKFTNKGSITVKIKELKRNDIQTTLEFSVADTGIGIPRDKHSLIFESYIQASPDTTRQFGGTGLGLAICKKLVDLQGGKISLQSEPGKGSVFTFVLSFGLPQKGTPKSPEETHDNFVGIEGKKILVAEDNKINFFVANKFLINWGAVVTHAENGQIALELLEKEEFDLILMDLHMPVLDGIEATKIIRKSENEKLRNIPIVALTAAIMSESYDKIDGLNINDYVLKPFKPHDLFDRIKRNIR